MKIELTSTAPLKYPAPALVIGCFEDSRDDLFNRCDAALGGCLQRLADSREFTGAAATSRLIHTLGRLPAERLLLVGLGKKKGFDEGRLRSAAGTAVQALLGARVASFSSALHLSGGLEQRSGGGLRGDAAGELPLRALQDQGPGQALQLQRHDPAAAQGVLRQGGPYAGSSGPRRSAGASPWHATWYRSPATWPPRPTWLTPPGCWPPGMP